MTSATTLAPTRGTAEKKIRLEAATVTRAATAKYSTVRRVGGGVRPSTSALPQSASAAPATDQASSASGGTRHWPPSLARLVDSPRSAPAPRSSRSGARHPPRRVVWPAAPAVMR